MRSGVGWRFSPASSLAGRAAVRIGHMAKKGPLARRRRYGAADGELHGWRGNEPKLHRAHRRLGAIGDAKFGDNLADVELDRTHADVERAGNRAVGLSLRHQPQHRLLTQRQLALGWRGK